MALGIFARAAAAGLAKLGEPSLLGGVPCGNANIERDVEVFAGQLGNADDNYVVRRDVATILAVFGPKVGGVLTHPDGVFRLERLLDQDGYRRRFVVLRVGAVETSLVLAWNVAGNPS